MSLLPGGFVIAATMAIIYGGWAVWQEPSALRTIIKTLSIGSLSLLSYRLGGPVLLTVALGFSALGDAFLANKGERNFLLGLGAFLLAHLAYSWLFLSGGSLTSQNIASPYNMAVAAALLMIAVLVMRNLWPHLGAMRLPVVCYVAAILAMGFTATNVSAQPLVVAGAAMFMASDIILSHELFVWNKEGKFRRTSPYAIWSLYWLGQAMIAWAYLSR